VKRLRSVPRRVVVAHVCVVGGLVLVGLVAWWHVWITGDPASTISCGCGDQSQELWFLTWTPWALVHGHNPFLTQAMFAGRGGANMMVNTSWMVPALVLSPVTWLFGPIATFNVAALLGPVVSGWTFFLAARKISPRLAGPVLGSFLYAFSPFVVTNEPFGHINFTLLFFPPLLFLLLYDLVVDHRHRPTRVGVALGVLVVVQFFTSTELLAMVSLVAVVGAVAAVVLAPHAAWACRRDVGTALWIAAAIVVVALAYPVWFLVDGPRHVVGFPWPNSPAVGGPATSIVNAGTRLRDPSPFLELGGYFGGAGPNFALSRYPSLFFLGFPLLAFLAVSSVAWYRVRVAWIVVVTGAAAWVFSFGTSLGTEFEPPSRQVHAWWLPWRALSHLPLIEDIQPIRFVGVVMFSVALLLVIGMDLLPEKVVAWAQRRWPPGPADVSGWARVSATKGRSSGAVIALTMVAVLAVVPVAATNSWPYAIHNQPMPTWFTDEAPRLPANTVALVTPFAGQNAIGWQARTGFAFRLANGFAVVPGRDGRSEFVQPPTGAVGILGRLSPAPHTIITGPPPGSHADVVAVRTAVVTWGVGVVVVTQVGVSAGYAAGFFTAVMGRAPTWRGESWVWTGPPGRSLTVGPHTLVRCQAAGKGMHDALAIPDCVLHAARSSART